MVCISKAIRNVFKLQCTSEFCWRKSVIGFFRWSTTRVPSQQQCEAYWIISESVQKRKNRPKSQRTERDALTKTYLHESSGAILVLSANPDKKAQMAGV